MSEHPWERMFEMIPADEDSLVRKAISDTHDRVRSFNRPRTWSEYLAFLDGRLTHYLGSVND